MVGARERSLYVAPPTAPPPPRPAVPPPPPALTDMQEEIIEALPTMLKQVVFAMLINVASTLYFNCYS